MSCTCSKKLLFRSRGFTLLEMSIVLLVLSLMLGGLLAVMTQETRRSKAEELKQKMDAIEYALVSYSKRSDTQRLPCPANPKLALDHADFGYAANPGCTTGSGSRAIPAELRDASAAGGTVPVRTLGLPDDYAFDPWGNKFTYLVALNITATDVLKSAPVTDNSLPFGVRVFPTNHTGISESYAALISHGANGAGAFNRSGVRKSFATSNTFEEANCGCTGGTVDNFSSTIYFGAFEGQENDETNQFDDIVRFYQREFFALPKDLASQ